MPVYTYRQFRKALQKAGFTTERSRKHEIWTKELEDGTVRRVLISHQHGGVGGDRVAKDIPTSLFPEMLRQAGLSCEEFERLLKDS